MHRRHGGHCPEPVDGPPDRDLIDRVRAGDIEAYDPLYRRHAHSALLHARHFTRTEAAAQDLRAESFTRVLAAIQGGNGPTEAMRPYLLTTMRRVARDWAETERHMLLVADPAEHEVPVETADPIIAALDRSLAGQAFAALPERWQTVLWHTEVEGEGPTELAPLLGIEPTAVAALAYRAREGLKQAYLQAHITEIGSEACQPYASRLGALARGHLGPRERAKIHRHVRECAECVGLLAMLKYLNGHIGAVVGPAVLGTAIAAKAMIGAAAGSVALGTAASGSTVSAPAGPAASGPVSLLTRGLAKARHASPRQQAAAVLTAAAVALAATAFALTGGQTAVPATAPRPKPAARPPLSSPSGAVAATPAPSSPPPRPNASPSPAPLPPTGPTATPPSPSPPPTVTTPLPSSASLSPPASPSSSPTPTPTPAMCPNDLASVIIGLAPGLQFTVGALVSMSGIPALSIVAGVGAGVVDAAAVPGCAGGPPSEY